MGFKGERAYGANSFCGVQGKPRQDASEMPIFPLGPAKRCPASMNLAFQFHACVDIWKCEGEVKNGERQRLVRDVSSELAILQLLRLRLHCTPLVRLF